jgi:hypothetical protein
MANEQVGFGPGRHRRWNVALSLRPHRILGEACRPHSPAAINLLLYHGVLAARARWRPQVVSYGRPEPDLKAREVDTSPRGAGTQRAWTWAALMCRVFALDVLACPRCGGPLRVIATIQDPLAVQAILAHLARTPAPEPPGPAPPTSAPIA